MSEEPAGESGVTPDPMPRTGTPEVDAVLEDVEAVAERPVTEHVAVFERAHERLRGALDRPAEPHAG